MKLRLIPFLLLLGGCAVGPDYHAPKMATPASYQEIPGTAAGLASIPEASQGDLTHWWGRFGDSELQSLIVRALRSNLDLLAALSRVREAREQVIVAGAGEWPQFNATGSAANVHSNSNLASKLFAPPGSSPTGGSGAGGNRGSNIKLYSAGVDATWELDIFGGGRRSIEAARANSQAALWQMRDGEVMLTAEIATDYIALRAAQAQLAIIRTEAQREQDMLNMVSWRLRAGFVTELDVDQQNVLLATTQAQMAPLQAQAAVMEHALAVLLAEQPEALATELDRGAALPAVPAVLPVGLPSDLLRRRPDVREAERKLAAATAQVGVAVSDLFPKFNLIGALSFSGSHLSGLLSQGNLGDVGYGSITWPIFHAGQINANIRSKEEERKQAYYAYQKAVLGAVRDAEDALVRFTTDQQRVRSLERAVASGRTSADISMHQYRAGLVAYVSVLTAQSNYLSAQDQLEQARQAFAADAVSLYRALGGGWSS